MTPPKERGHVPRRSGQACSGGGASRPEPRLPFPSFPERGNVSLNTAHALRIPLQSLSPKPAASRPFAIGNERGDTQR
jgi:hypothetical protein